MFLESVIRITWNSTQQEVYHKEVKWIRVIADDVRRNRTLTFHVYLRTRHQEDFEAIDGLA